MSMVFGSKNGILIRSMTVEDYKNISGRIVKDIPLATYIREKVKDFSQNFDKKKFDDYHISIVEQGNCLVAVNENDGGKIVGQVIAGIQVPSDLEKHREKTGEVRNLSLRGVSDYLTEIERKANIYERFGVTKALYSHITNVDASMRGREIGAQLATALMELGRSKAFPLMVATCTSFYSARQKEALGMECVYSEAYEDYRDEKGEVIYNLPAPHTHVRVMAIRL